MEIVTAVYERGVLRPLQPLDLQEQQKVRIQILPEELDVLEEPGDNTDALIERTACYPPTTAQPTTPARPSPAHRAGVQGVG